MPYNHCTILIAKVKTWLPPILLTYAANGERREQTFKPNIQGNHKLFSKNNNDD